MSIVVKIALGVLGGAGAGAGLTAWITRDTVEEVAPDPTPVVQAETARELSKLDILGPLCDPEYMGENGTDICREMYCWAQTNSTTGEASGIACEKISNINNTVSIWKTCAGLEDELVQAACYTLFRERK